MTTDVEYLFMCLLAICISSFHLFVYFWFCWVFVVACGLSLVTVAGAPL